MCIKSSQCLHATGTVLWTFQADLCGPQCQHSANPQRVRMPGRIAQLGPFVPVRLQDPDRTGDSWAKFGLGPWCHSPNLMGRRTQRRLDHAVLAHRHRLRLPSVGQSGTCQHLFSAVHRAVDDLARWRRRISRQHSSIHLHRFRRIRRRPMDWSRRSLQHHEFGGDRCHGMRPCDQHLRRHFSSGLGGYS